MSVSDVSSERSPPGDTERFGDIVAKPGADVLIANHTNLDGSKVKLPPLGSPARR